MKVDSNVLDQYKELLPPKGWMKAIVIGADERKSQRGLDMFDIHFEIIEEYNTDEDNFENTLGYRISTVAVYPNQDIQGDKAKATGQAFKAFTEAFELNDGEITAMDIKGKEVMILVTYQKGQDGKERPAINFGGFAKVEA